MSQRDAFSDWLEQFTYLSETETSNLPEWQRPIAFIHQFAVNSMFDGVGSLFYNDLECIDAVSRSFDGFGEIEMRRKIQEIDNILGPRVESGPQNWQDIRIEQIQVGLASSAADELDKMLSDRWHALYSQLEDHARLNGWKP
jgi:hypothetical protein